MDALSEILKSMKMRHTAAGMLRLSAPWGLNVRGFDSPIAYGVANGPPCWLRMRNGEAVQLAEGDMALVLGEHQLLHSLEARPSDMGEAWAANGLPPFEPAREPAAPLDFRWGGGGAETRLLGLAFGLASGRRNPLVASLPACIVLRRERDEFPWMQPAIVSLSSERSGAPGYAATVRLLAELVFVSIVRAHLQNESKGSRGWLRGLTDVRIARALQAIHREPGAGWTVGTLASEAGLSRTAFATRFVELVETTPIDYLTQWRMHLAAERIAQSRSNLTQLAFELGYASDAAFREAFKRRYGVAPSRYAADTDFP